MDYAKLASEIDKPAYADLSDPQIVAALKGGSVPGPYVDIPTPLIVGYLALAGKLYGIQQFAKQPENQDQVHDGALVAANSLLSVMGTIPVFNASDAGKRAIMVGMLAKFVAQNLLSTDDEAALLGMAQTSTTLLASLDCPELQGMDEGCVVDHMQHARGVDPQEARKSAQ